MIQRRVQYALQLAIQAEGLDRVAYAELRRIDPLLRGAVRRGIQRAIREALFATTVPSMHPEGALHLMRLSYLYAARGLDGVTPDDVEAVCMQYQSLPTCQKPLGFWWPSLVVLALVVGASVFFWLSWQQKAARQRLDASLRPAPPPSGAFASGGAPSTQDSGLYDTLTEAVPSYIIALDRVQRLKDGTDKNAGAYWVKELSASRQKILSEATKQALGERGFACLQRVLGAAEEVTRAEPDDASAGVELFMESVGALNDELAAQGVGYFVDSDVITSSSGRFAVLYSFAVENVDLFSIEGNIIRALTLRRIDNLNLSQSLLGFTRPQLRDALLLRAQVDELLVSYVLPGLAPGALVSLVDEETEAMAPTWQEPAERRAAQLIHEEYGNKLPANATQIGELLNRRRLLFLKWNQALSSHGMHLSPPDTLVGQGHYEEELEGFVPKAELAEFLKIQEQLASSEAAQALAAARSLLALSVARHEVQHRADFSRATPRRTPISLIEFVGMEISEGGVENKFATQTKDELSAYLGELARDEATTRVNLTLLSRFLFNRDLWGGAESYVALVIFQELGGELGLIVPTLLESGGIQREKVSSLYLQLTDKKSQELQAAAARVWERQFGEPLPEMKRASPYTKYKVRGE
jgi:hypothetical protein